MKTWIPKPPSPSALSDHDVDVLGAHLRGKRIALMVTGGIAAMKAPLLARSLRRYQADVVAYVSSEALKYTTLDALEWSTFNPVVTQLSAQSEHLSKEKPFDAYVVAPATYNTINKFRHGIADSPVTTTLASALSLVAKKQTKIFVAPTMHGDFHNPILEESLNKLSEFGVKIIPPRDAYGKHNLPDLKTLTAFVCHSMSDSPLAGKKVLITSGSTPTFIDSVRTVSNRFRGRLGLEISRYFYLKGMDVVHLYGAGAVEPDSFLRSIKTFSYDDYKEKVMQILSSEQFDLGIFSAAVADYKPEKTVAGKIKSGGGLQSVNFVPTEKVIDMVRASYPELPMVSFKFESQISNSDLFAIAAKRIEKGHLAVVANRDEDTDFNGKQKAYLVSKHQDPIDFQGKPAIAKGLFEFLESSLG